MGDGAVKETLMIKSMTGFGRCEISEGTKKISMEIKAVNHRYLDVTVKMPKKLNMFEAAIRSELKQDIQRGKVDLFITYEDTSEGMALIQYNKETAAEYMRYFAQMASDFGLENDVRVSTLARCPEVLVMDEQNEDEEEIWKLLQRALNGAVQNLVDARIREGENLKADLLQKLDEMLESVAFIEERSPQIIADYRERLTDKVREMLGERTMDEGRIITEVTIYADRICVDEELVRLRSHIEAVKKALIDGGSIGRKLDFLAQEMNREANTILSKSSDLSVSNCGIELKTTIEKVREQIQNIE